MANERTIVTCSAEAKHILIYIAKELQGQIDSEQLYRRTLVRIPTPRFLVFYNGTDQQPETFE